MEHGAGGGGTTKRKSKRDKRQRRKSGGGAAGGAGVASAAATKSVATGTTDADARPDSRCHHDDESADDELDRRQSIDIDDQVRRNGIVSIMPMLTVFELAIPTLVEVENISLIIFTNRFLFVFFCCLM